MRGKTVSGCDAKRWEMERRFSGGKELCRLGSGLSSMAACSFF